MKTNRAKQIEERFTCGPEADPTPFYGRIGDGPLFYFPKGIGGGSIIVEESTTAALDPTPRWKLPLPQKNSLAYIADNCEVCFAELHQPLCVHIDDLRGFIETYDKLIASRNRGSAYTYLHNHHLDERHLSGWYPLWKAFAERQAINTQVCLPSWTKADALVLADLKEFWNDITSNDSNMMIECIERSDMNINAL